jgi:hypothetical protein
MVTRLQQLLARLDAFGADDPDNNEGFIEDRCSVCGVPRIAHPCFAHRWHALLIMAIRRWT